MFMLEKAVVGSRRYWMWVACLLTVITVSFLFYLRQLHYGLGITGMSRDVSWGLYIGQFTFMVGVAASAVMVVLPYYLHNHKEFARMTVLGEFLAVSSVTMCMLFVFVDMGQPQRVLNVFLYPQPHSVMFWDMVSLSGYLLINVTITLVSLHAEQQDVAPAHWIKAVILLSIPWAISIHTVTAFLYSGLPGRLSWRTAIMAPRFLASAFAAGPALLILLCLLLRRLTGYDVGKKAIRGLSVIVTYAMLITIFFMLMELFTALYSRVPELMEDFRVLYLGAAGHTLLLYAARLSVVLMVGAAIMLLTPSVRGNEKTLAAACVLVFVSLWIDKGLCLTVSGFTPSPLGTITSYVPTLPEIMIALGVWAVGALMVTVFYKIALSVEIEREFVNTSESEARTAVGAAAAHAFAGAGKPTADATGSPHA
jgi:[DsrC]-trisulfide reductase subunit P